MMAVKTNLTASHLPDNLFGKEAKAELLGRISADSEKTLVGALHWYSCGVPEKTTSRWHNVWVFVQ